jgi:hypothetical protein
MSDQDNPKIMLRIGVRFERMSSGERVALDRYVFAMMKRKASARNLSGGPERRVAPRVEIAEAEDLTAVLLPSRPLGALARSTAEEAAKPPTRFKISDISTTGCSFSCVEQDAPGRKQVLNLRLEGEGISVELAAKVINTRKPKP